MKTGQINNCEKCGASYSTYNTETEGHDDWKEMWCELPCFEDGTVKPAKGLCQFCNSESKYYLQ